MRCGFGNTCLEGRFSARDAPMPKIDIPGAVNPWTHVAVSGKGDERLQLLSPSVRKPWLDVFFIQSRYLLMGHMVYPGGIVFMRTLAFINMG